MKNTGMNRLVVVAAVFACGLAACGMPTKEELVQAQALVADLTADDVRAMKSGAKKPGEVAAAQVALADEAETEAGKYLLLQGAFRLYSRSADYDAAADVLVRMRRDIANLPPEVVVELVNGEFRRVTAGKAEKVMVIYRDARRTIKYRKDLAAAEKAAAAKPSDVVAQRRVAECHAILGDWAKALESFAKLGEDAAKFELDPTSAKGCDVSKAADFWWNYPAKDSYPFKIHAVDLYQKGLAGGSITGLRKTLAEKRVKQMESVMQAEGDNATATTPRGSGAPAASDSGAEEPPAKVAAPAPAPNGKEISVKLATGVTMDFVPCPEGTFEMGLPSDDNPRSPEFRHVVQISRPFWIGKYQVTWRQWRVFGKDQLDDMINALGGLDAAKDKVSYKNAIWFCESMNKKFKRYLPKGYVYRLPTEAEWLYALYANCMDESDPYVQFFSGNKSKYKEIAVTQDDRMKMIEAYGLPANRIPKHVWPPMKVGTKKPNAWGLYDMLGNGGHALLDTCQIDNFKKRWGRNEHVDLAGAFFYKEKEIDPLHYAPSNASRPCSCYIFGRHDKIASQIGRGVEQHASFRLVIGPDLLKERGIKLPNLGK